MNRTLLTKTHTVLAGFFFTTTLLLIITGGLMNIGVEGSYDKTSYVIEVKQPLPTEISIVKNVVINELNKRRIPLPKGKIDLEIDGSVLVFEWEGARYNAILENDTSTQQTKLILEQASTFSYLENLHKSEGGPAFKILAIFCSLGLIVLLVTGILMAWQAPKYRILTIKSILLGAAFFLLTIFLS